jgi:hypothetical protein
LPLDHFADRFDHALYADDPVVGVFEVDSDEADALWFPERIFARLIGVARAYELHTLPQLGGLEPVRLNKLQCEAAIEEIAFVANRLADDPLIAEVAEAISDYVVVRVRRPGWDGTITFEGE